MMQSRREFLAATLATLAAGPAFAAKTAPRQLGIQLYMLDDELAQDAAVTLSAVREIGYQQVELASLHGRSADEWKSALKRAGLTCVSLHAPTTAPAGEPSLVSAPQAFMDIAQTLGAQHIVCGMPLLPPAVTKVASDRKAFAAAVRAMKLDDWKRHADFLNKTGELVGAAGLTFAYHNHNLEFVEYKEETAYDVLLRLTDPAAVKMQLDCAWMVAGRRDPLWYLTKHGNRFVSLHVKDLAPGVNDILRLNPADVGQGIIDWSRVLPAALTAGVQYFFVEQEKPYPRGAMQSARNAYQYLRSLPSFVVATR